MNQFKQRITATVSAILIALAMIGSNTNQAIAQGNARKGAKARAGAGTTSTIISPRDPASGLPSGKRGSQTGTTSSSSSKNELAIEAIELGRRGHTRTRIGQKR